MRMRTLRLDVTASFMKLLKLNFAGLSLFVFFFFVFFLFAFVSAVARLLLCWTLLLLLLLLLPLLLLSCSPSQSSPTPSRSQLMAAGDATVRAFLLLGVESPPGNPDDAPPLRVADRASYATHMRTRERGVRQTCGNPPWHRHVRARKHCGAQQQTLLQNSVRNDDASRTCTVPSLSCPTAQPRPAQSGTRPATPGDSRRLQTCFRRVPNGGALVPVSEVSRHRNRPACPTGVKTAKQDIRSSGAKQAQLSHTPVTPAARH